MNLNESTELVHFTCTSTYYRFLGDYMLTDGTEYVCRTYGCYWLVVQIIKQQEQHKNESFLVFNLVRVEGKNGAFALIIDDGNNNILGTVHLKSDFKPDRLTFWCVNKIILLPSEY